MFRKVVSKAALSPMLIGELRLYTRVLARETTLRKMTLLFAALLLAAQLLIAFNPTEALPSDLHVTKAATLDIPSIERSQTATNLSAQRSAKQVTNSGDQRIEYTLLTTNSSDSTHTVPIQINLGDLLEYATLKENGGANLDLDTLNWGDAILKAHQTDTRHFVIQIKDSVPATPQAKNNPLSYDCTLTTNYGNQLDLSLECPSMKIIEYTINSLPKINLSTNVALDTTILLISFYLLLRARQFFKEANLLRKELGGRTL